MKNGRIQFITDKKQDLSFEKQAEDVCKGGIRWVQFRMKDSSITEKLEEAAKVAAICKKWDATFIINDDIEIAQKLKADGVHLGLSDMDPLKAREILGNNAIIGATCNTFEDICLRHRQKVDYIGLGPLRFTTTKKNLSPVIGLDGYKEIIGKCKEAGIDIPIVAIGGILVEDIKDIIDTGVYGIALSSLITKADDRISRTSEIISELKDNFHATACYI